MSAFRITGPLRLRGEVYRPGMEAAYLAARPTADEQAAHRAQGRIAGDVPAEATAAEAAPAPDGSESDALPRDFPGWRQLTAAGHGTAAAVRRLSESDLRAVKGVGEATAAQILTARKTL